MSITSALVLFAVLWFLTFLVVIPIRLKRRAMLARSCQARMPERRKITI